MKASTIVLSILLIFSLIACAFFAYMWIDRAITLSYSEDCVSNSTRTTKLLESLLENEWKGMPRQTIIKKLKKEIAEHSGDSALFVKEEKDNTIFFSDISFIFVDGKLYKVGK